MPSQGLKIPASDLRPASLLSVAGLNALTSSLRERDTKVLDLSPTGKKRTRKFARGPQFKESISDIRKRAAHSGHLEMMDALIREKKAASSEEKEEKGSSPTAKGKWKRSDKIVRPKTPRVQRNNSEVDDAISLLQRLVRGRCVQNEMFAGKEKNLDLINELRYSENDDEDNRIEQTVEEKMRLAEDAAAGAIGGTIVAGALKAVENESSREAEEGRICNSWKEWRERGP